MTTPSSQTRFLRRTPAGDGHPRAADGSAWAAGNHERATGERIGATLTRDTGGRRQAPGDSPGGLASCRPFTR